MAYPTHNYRYVTSEPSMRLYFLLCVLAVSILRATAASPNSIATVPLAETRTTDTGQLLNVPAYPTVIVTQTTTAPGARTPTHKHPYPRYVYVTDGTLTVVNETTRRSLEVRKGGFLSEMVNTWHHGENRGKIPVRLIAIDQVPEGVHSNTTIESGR